MQVEMPGHGPVDLLQEPDEFLGAMAGQTFANHLAGLHVKAANSVVVPCRL